MSQTDTSQTGTDELAGEQHPLSRVRTDLFCRECGASLYERPVWRTTEARLLVVRCERCETIVSANEVLPYRRIWRQRVGAMMTLGWLCVLGGLLVAAAGVQADLQVYTPVVSYARASSQFPLLDADRTRARLVRSISISLVVSFVVGCVLACGLYHWPTWCHSLAAAGLPALVLALVRLSRSGPLYAKWYAAGALGVMVGVMAVQIVGGIVGALVGRAVARGALRMALPNRLRGFFAFLWRRDGMDMPVGPW